MDLQSNNSDLFSPINEQAAEVYSQHPAFFSGRCSIYPSSSHDSTLRLISNYLFLTHQQQTPLFIELSFEIKFQVLYQQQKNVQSPKIGIRFYDQSKRQTLIYCESFQIDQWSIILGKRLNQRGFHQMFKPIKKLGKGNFATVYEAERLTDKQKFAVKAFSKQNSYSAKNGKESLMNELAILRELNTEPHPNVLKLQAVYESDNSIYVVLQLLTGMTLFQLIQERRGHFSKSQVVTLSSGLLRGLEHLHSHRIMHRDLKPQNIMLKGKTLEPVIVDFGLATNADLKEYLFFRCGTPGYVAPEIIKLAQSEHVEPACDIFSLGAIFHILLVRKPLFEGTRYEQVYKNNKEFKICLTTETYHSVENSALDILKGMLELDPTKRSSAGELLKSQFFCEDMAVSEQTTEVKIGSPVLTESSVKDKEKKKKNFLFF